MGKRRLPSASSWLAQITRWRPDSWQERKWPRANRFHGACLTIEEWPLCRLVWFESLTPNYCNSEHQLLWLWIFTLNHKNKKLTTIESNSPLLITLRIISAFVHSSVGDDKWFRSLRAARSTSILRISSVCAADWRLELNSSRGWLGGDRLRHRQGDSVGDRRSWCSHLGWRQGESKEAPYAEIISWSGNI